jgi:hypothetical protein
MNLRDLPNLRAKNILKIRVTFAIYEKSFLTL